VSEPRIVTPQEAQETLTPDAEWEARLLYTVATEPDRLRAAVAKALRDAALFYGPAQLTGMFSRDGYTKAWLANRADAIENGANW
jgi:hypothetical protein